MEPSLFATEEVLVQPLNRSSLPLQHGDIVVARSPEKPDLKIIKRIIKQNSQGQYWLQGDNGSHSRDSRHFGWVTGELIEGRMTCRF